jgi:hypothetical protein
MPEPSNNGIMRYRIELSNTRKGFGRIQLPGRKIALEAKPQGGANMDTAAEWEVLVTDLAAASGGSVALRAADANDAVWRVARAAVRAVSELTGNPIEGELNAEPDSNRNNFS